MTSTKDRWLADAIGTLRSYWRVGAVRIKDVSGVLQVRNSGDTADANLKAAALQLVTGAGAGKIPQSDASGNLTLVTPETLGSDVGYTTNWLVLPQTMQSVSGNFGSPVVSSASQMNMFSLLSGNGGEVKCYLPMGAGHWNLYVSGLKSSLSGDVQLFLDGTSVNTQSGYNATSIVWQWSWDLGTLSAGLHQINLKINGHQPSSTGYNFYCSYITLGIV